MNCVAGHYYLVAIHDGPRMFALRLPLKGAKWRDIFKACTPIMHAQGKLSKDIHTFEGFKEEHDPKFFAALDRAAGGDTGACLQFDIWTWDGDRFTLARERIIGD